MFKKLLLALLTSVSVCASYEAGSFLEARSYKQQAIAHACAGYRHDDGAWQWEQSFIPQVDVTNLAPLPTPKPIKKNIHKKVRE